MNSKADFANATATNGYRRVAHTHRLSGLAASFAKRCLSKLPDGKRGIAAAPDTDDESVAAPRLAQMIQFDAEHNRIHRGPVTVAMCAQERRLLELLIEEETRSVPKAQLIRGVWGDRASVIVDANLAHLVCRLRKQLCCVGLPDVIRTVPGIGYKLLIDGVQSEAQEAIEPGPTKGSGTRGEKGSAYFLKRLLIVLSGWMVVWQMTSTLTESKPQLPEGIEKTDLIYGNTRTTVYEIGQTGISYQNVLEHVMNTCNVHKLRWIMYFISGQDVYIDLYTENGVHRCVAAINTVEKARRG